MKVKIVGDKKNNYNGILKANFYADEKIHQLEFNLENWEDANTHGYIGGEYIQIVYPEPMNFTFDQDYELEIESARKVYQVLCKHGWEKIETK